MDALRQIRFALRRLAQRPAFTAVAIASLAIGIGANSAMFSLIDSVVWRSQPFADPDSLVELYTANPEFPYSPFSYPDYEDLKRSAGDIFESLGGSGLAFVQADRDGAIEGLVGELISADYFSMLGIDLAMGSGIQPENDVEGAAPVAVIGYDYWQKALGGRDDVLEQTLRLNGRVVPIVGVAPQEFRGSLRGLVADVFLPVTSDVIFNVGSSRLESRGSHWFFLKGRRKPGVTDTEIATKLAAFTQQLKEQHTDQWDRKEGVTFVPTSRVILNPMIDNYIRAGAYVLLALVAVVLTIACANLASFLVARATDQRKDFAVRLALGATRWQLIRQQLLDALLLSTAGGGLGLALAAGLVRGMRNVSVPVTLPIRVEPQIDLRLLLFCLGATLASALLFGLAPALQSTRLQAAPVLKDESTGGGARKQRLRGALVIAQVALSTCLLVSAGLFLRALVAAQAADPGFGDAPTAMLAFSVPEKYDATASQRPFFEKLRSQVAALPEVEAVGLIDNPNLTLSNQQGTAFNVPGMAPPGGEDYFVADYAYVDTGYFAAAGVPVVEGRAFNPDDRDDSPGVVIVSQAFARRFFPGESAIGKTLTRNEEDEGGALTVVGVARDTMVRYLGETPRPFLYLDTAQRRQTYVTVLARTRGDAKAMSRTLLTTARELEPDLVVIESTTMHDHLATMLLPARALAGSFVAFAGLALLLAVIGLYGVVSCAVSARSREVGIRLSLGARGGSIVRLLMRGGALLVTVGAFVGMVLAFVLSQGLSSLLFAVDARDPIVFLSVPLILAAATVLATLLPARRALRSSPTAVLRST